MTTRSEELDHRENDGIAVTLLWNRRTNALAVRVYDNAEDEEFGFACAADEALEAFRHPRGVRKLRRPRIRG